MVEINVKRPARGPAQREDKPALADRLVVDD